MISLARYAAIFKLPDLKAIAIASVIGRLPIGIAGLAIMLLTQQLTGSFARSGVAAAGYLAGLAATAPVLGRYIDRHGPSRILALSGIAYPTAMLLLLVAAHAGLPEAALAAAAFAAGASFPPITVCMRTLLKQLLRDDAQLHAAYSLESVLIETIFIVGPLLVALLVTLWSPGVAVAFAAVCASVGAASFLRSPALSRWRIESRAPSSIFGPLADARFPALLAVVLCYSAAFGLIEIAMTGYAAAWGQPALAGVLLGLMSIGSAAGALVYGSRSWRWTLERQYATTLALMGAGCAVISMLERPASFALGGAIAALVMSPPLIIQSMLVAKLARPDHCTEAFTWISTGLLVGVGLGIAAGGVLIETRGTASPLEAAAALSLLASALAATLVRSPA